MSDSRIFFLRYPVTVQANVPDPILAVEHVLAGAAGYSDQDQRPLLRCFRLEETAAIVIIYVFLLEYVLAL